MKEKDHKKEVPYSDYLNCKVDLESYKKEWNDSKPFNHIVVENFLNEATCRVVASEFPDFDDESWRVYNNAIEVKKILNQWDRFGPATYRLFSFLNSRPFIEKLELLTECRLFADFGLNGGGLHAHAAGGKLNTHLDYSMHPKLKLERRLNLIIYVTPNWKFEYGGGFGAMGKKYYQKRTWTVGQERRSAVQSGSYF